MSGLIVCVICDRYVSSGSIDLWLVARVWNPPFNASVVVVWRYIDRHGWHTKHARSHPVVNPCYYWLPPGILPSQRWHPNISYLCSVYGRYYFGHTILYVWIFKLSTIYFLKKHLTFIPLIWNVILRCILANFKLFNFHKYHNVSIAANIIIITVTVIINVADDNNF